MRWNGPCAAAALRSAPITTRSPHQGASNARNSGRRTWPQTTAPEAAASWQARWPTPPVAPSISTLRPSSSPPWRSACSAVNPATGRQAACASLTPSGSGASQSPVARTRSAQAPDGNKPTTRVPAGGPLPSAAPSSTTPAKSQPGRAPAGLCDKARLTSPRLSEIAATRTVASAGPAGASSTVPIASPSGLAGSTTTAHTICGIGASSG